MSGNIFLLVMAAVLITDVTRGADGARAIPRERFDSETRTLVVELLSDELAHFELVPRRPGGDAAPIATSPMVARVAHPGPTRYRREGTTLRTAALTLIVDPAGLCITAVDARRNVTLTTVCPIAGGKTGLTLTREGTRDLFGLGQQFFSSGDAGPGWIGRQRSPGCAFGNQMTGFGGGATGNTQIPVLYALGKGSESHALFLDDTLAQRWDFTGSPWKVETGGTALRWYLFAGESLSHLRRTFVDLVGRPLVPPKRSFGLWVSEYGFRNWAEVDAKLSALRAKRFPVDGFVLDLFWFGGIREHSDDSSMGRVAWDTGNFPDAKEKIASFAREHGVGLIPIEESYVSRNLPEHRALEEKGFLARDPSGKATYLTGNPWWGKGGMIDWTSPAAADFWHDWKRNPLIRDGVAGHWLDLGEPEMFDERSRYAGGSHAEIHNLFNFRWIESVHRGYTRHFPKLRPFMLSRSGTAGVQRFGAAMWSGDIGSSLDSLRSHFDAAANVSLSGIDYFGADVGGFHRKAVTGSPDEMYTQWLASAALMDVPVRPHTENLCRCKETSPAGIGDTASNLFNLRLRYSLVPYLYSLAHRAHLDGEPVFPPAFFHFPEDEQLRKLGNQKMIGRSLLVAGVARHGATHADVYLPKGEWVDFHSRGRLSSRGEKFPSYPLHHAGAFRPPLFARAGAIVPKMHVDDLTMNTDGRRLDGSVRDELIIAVVPAAAETDFTLFEDDGATTDYLAGGVRRTVIRQQRSDSAIDVNVGRAEGTFAGAKDARRIVLDLYTGDRPSGVTIDGTGLARHETLAAWEASEKGGWLARDGQILVKTGPLPVATQKRFRIQFP